MLPKKNKFSRLEFNKLPTLKPRKIFTDIGVFNVYESLGHFKSNIVLNKRNFKTAVIRNKYKRLFYNTLLDLQNESGFKKTSFIFYPKKTFEKKVLAEEISKL